MTITLPDTVCYLNGAYTPLREARISVLDRGFIFGDGVYEVVPIYNGVPFFFAEHMTRLERSLDELRIANPRTPAQWREIAAHLMAHDNAPSRALYIQVTRGVALREHSMPQGLEPTVFAMINPMPPVPASARERGVACVTAEDFRWKKAHIKATSLLGAVLARQISVDAGAAETVMFRDGALSEASSSNVWVVKNGRVAGVTPDELVLRGIRYGVIGRLCADAGIPFELRRVARDEVFDADELLLSSASKEVLAVSALDGQVIGSGRPGPIYEKLYAAYQQEKARQQSAVAHESPEQ
jgi:D-alanine transaminase